MITNKNSYFPIKIIIQDSGHKNYGEPIVIKYKDIPKGTPFIVTKTKVKINV